LGISRPLRLARAGAARDLHYWGHYPVADMEVDWDCPVRAGLRAWSPFVPGDIDASMVPGAVFGALRRCRPPPARARQPAGRSLAPIQRGAWSCRTPRGRDQRDRPARPLLQER
jgi:hypothetical protein